MNFADTTSAAAASTGAAVKKHPAGTFAGTGGVLAGLLISQGHLTSEQAGAVVAALGLLTTAISYLNAHGGIRGLIRELLDGSSEE